LVLVLVTGKKMGGIRFPLNMKPIAIKWCAHRLG